MSESTNPRRFQFSLQSLMLFIIGVAASMTMIAANGAYQPFGVVALGYVVVLALLGGSTGFK